MTTASSASLHGSRSHLYEHLAAWILAFTLVLAMASTSVVALLFENWT